MVVVVVWVGGCELSCGWGELGDGGRKGRRKKVVSSCSSSPATQGAPHHHISARFLQNWL